MRVRGHALVLTPPCRLRGLGGAESTGGGAAEVALGLAEIVFELGEVGGDTAASSFTGFSGAVQLLSRRLVLNSYGNGC